MVWTVNDLPPTAPAITAMQEMLAVLEGLRVQGDYIQWKLFGADWANIIALPAGPEGLSAYEVALAGGYVGTATQWLASLVGPKGDNAANPIFTVVTAVLAAGATPNVTLTGTYPNLTLTFGFPPIKRVDSYTGTTDANGLFTVTYPTAFAARPIVSPEPPSVANRSWVTVSSTATGFSLRLVERAVLSVLALEVLAGTPTPVPSIAVRAMVVAA